MLFEKIDVLLINSPLFYEDSFLEDEDYLPPLGLGYIATNLSSNGLVVELLDAVALSIGVQKIIQEIKLKKPDFVGLNIFTTNFHLVREIVESVNDSHFIIGGLLTGSAYRHILEWQTDSYLDIVLGDGDYIVAGIVLGEVLPEIYNSEKKRVIDVSVNSNYFPTDISSMPLDRKFFTDVNRNTNELCIITSRGCIYNCAFCSAARSLNSSIPVRERCVKSVENEIRLAREYDSRIKTVRVLDDLFIKNSDSVVKASAIFAELPVTWRAMAHVLSFKQLSDTELINLKRSGCSEVFIGIESGSPRILRKIHKTSNTDLIKHVICRLFKAGISVKAYFIFGFDSETEDDMMMTYSLAKELKEVSKSKGVSFRTSVFQFRPYHGTELYNQLVGMDGVIGTSHQSSMNGMVGRAQPRF